MRKIITEEIKNNMVLDFKQGMSLLQLSEKYEFQIQTIKKHLKENGIEETHVKRFTQEELKNIIDDYNLGMKPYELSLKYNRDSGTIIGKLKSIGAYRNSTYHFTKDDIDFLRIHYPKGEWDIILKRFPKSTKSSIYTKMSKLGIHLEDYYWTENDICLLKETYPNLCGNIKELINIFDGKYTYSAIVSKAEKLGLKCREFWTESEIKILREHYSICTVDEMLLLLPNRTRNSIIGQAIKLGLVNKTTLTTQFNDFEKDFIKNNYCRLTDKEIGERINRSASVINNYRYRNNLIKLHERSSYLDLAEYVRRNNLKWKKASMKNCHYKCVLSGERFDDIHHIHSLNLILDETLNLLKLEIKEDINDYSAIEMKNILETFRDIQNKYPLGVCLTKEIHQQFHNIFGYGNNTQDQWNKFIQNYNKNIA
jgi:hypothetical protein|nr:MAG TPA: CCAAT/enhancer-binding protein beta [Caudoviricetes sp.]